MTGESDCFAPGSTTVARDSLNGVLVIAGIFSGVVELEKSIFANSQERLPKTFDGFGALMKLVWDRCKR